MSASEPKISVITAVFNGAPTLPRMLDSFAAQAYPHKELIVLDGGSTDGTLEILRARDGFLSYWESQPDNGIYHAWNKGLEHVTGEWVCFLGADDYFWREDSLERLVAGLQAAPPAARVVYGQVAVLSPKGDLLRYEGGPWEQAKRDLDWSLPIPHPGLLHHASLFQERGGFDESFRIVGDYELLLRELQTGIAHFVPDVVTVAFQHGGLSNSPRSMGKMLAEIAQARRKHGLTWRGTGHLSSTRIKMLLTAWSVRCIGERGFCWMADGFRRALGKPPVWQELYGPGR